MLDQLFEQMIEILVVDDSPHDQQLLLDALQRTGVAHHVNVLADGAEALSFLQHQSGYESAPRPHLILLDMQLPRKTGPQVLAEIKADPELRTIPVIMMSSLGRSHDVSECYALQASCFVHKTLDGRKLQQMAEYWLSVACLPPANP